MFTDESKEDKMSSYTIHVGNFSTMNILLLCTVGCSLYTSLAVLQFFNRDTFISHFVAHTGHIRDTSWAAVLDDPLLFSKWLIFCVILLLLLI